MPKPVEDCVKKRLANEDFQAPKGFEGDRESFAYALCNSEYKKGMLGQTAYITVNGQTFYSEDELQWIKAAVTIEEPTKEDISMMNSFTAELTPGSIIKFTDAVLVRAEINKNNDEIDATGVQEIATSLPLKPIDHEHKQDKIVGIFIDASVVDDAVSTKGLIWAGRHPQIAHDLVAGDGHLSVDARAKMAICAECGGSYGNFKEYCAHINRNEGGQAIRKLEGLEANGGSIVPNPAGTDTAIPSQSLRMIAHLEGQTIDSGYSVPRSFERITALVTAKLQEGLPKDEPWPWIRYTFSDYVIVEKKGKLYRIPFEISDKEEVSLGEWEEVEEAFIKAMKEEPETVSLMLEFEEEIYLEGKQLSYKERQNLEDKNFALIQKKDGKKIRRFPIHDCSHARNALARLSGAKNLSADERAKVKKKAQAKVNSKECQSKTKGGKNVEEELQKQLDLVKAEVLAKTEELEAMQTKAEGLETELQEVRSSLEAERDSEMEKREAVEKERDELQTKLDDQKLKARLEKVTPFIASEELGEKEEAIAEMTEDAFNMLVAAYEAADDTSTSRGTVLVSDDDGGGEEVLAWS